MRLKQKPEDFSVKESYRFDEVRDGKFYVYLMDKQKLSTFDAITRLQEKFSLRPGSISYCGLKDKQGRTEQLIAVEGKEIEYQDEQLRVKFLGRTDAPLSAKNTTSNRFAVTVRQVREEELSQLTVAAAEVARLGVINYFDSQRFGSLKHGQGFIAKDLFRGDFEAALKNYLAKPSPLDRSEDAKVKQFWLENWGDWTARCPYVANAKYSRILRSLRSKPDDFLTAFLQIDSDYRAMLLFTYQSFLWNEGVRRYLQLTMPREHLFPMPYQAGTVLHHRDVSHDILPKLREVTFPLLAPNSTFKDAQVEEAAKWVLGREKMKLEDLQVKESKLLYFKHEERPVLVTPQKLVIGKPRPDELNRGFFKVNIAFTLPPGSYATLVVKRLFHFAFKKESDYEGDRTFHREEPAGGKPRGAAPRPGSERKPHQAEREYDEADDELDDDEISEAGAPPARGSRAAAPARPAKPPRSERKPRHEPRPGAPVPEPKPAGEKPKGFLERQREKKLQRATNRANAKS